MIHIGDYNKLTILRDTEPGLFLGDDEDQEVLLPNRYVPEEFEIDDTIEVFVYLDNEERLVAVTDHPYIKKGEFALLRCNNVTEIGAFLDWGLVKELFCPFREQAFPMKAGGWYLVYCYLDETSERLVASSKTNRFLDNKELTVQAFDEVDLIVSHPSDLGMNVIINKSHAYSEVENTITKGKIRHLSSFNLVNTYEGKDIEAGTISMTLRFIFQSNTKSLTDSEINDSMKKAFQLLERGLKAKIRS